MIWMKTKKCAFVSDLINPILVLRRYRNRYWIPFTKTSIRWVSLAIELLKNVCVLRSEKMYNKFKIWGNISPGWRFTRVWKRGNLMIDCSVCLQYTTSLSFSFSYIFYLLFSTYDNEIKRRFVKSKPHGMDCSVGNKRRDTEARHWFFTFTIAAKSLRSLRYHKNINQTEKIMTLLPQQNVLLM